MVECKAAAKNLLRASRIGVFCRNARLKVTLIAVG